MGKFEDEIRKKLQEGKIETPPSGWEQMDKKLSEQNSFTSFERKIQNSLSEGSVAMPAGSWEQFSDNFNSLDQFEKNIADKLNEGESTYQPEHWEEFSDKLADSNLTSFEQSTKSILNSGKITYNHKNWLALEKALHGSNTKKILWRSAAAILLLIGAGIGINYSLNSNSEAENTKSSAKEETISQNQKIKTGSINSTELDLKSVQSINNENSFNDAAKFSNSKKEQNLVKSKSKNFIISKKDKAKKSTQKVAKKALESANDSIVNNTPSKSNIENIFDYPTIAIDFEKVELCSPMELLTKQIIDSKKPSAPLQLHAGATMWLNFWENPALTGFYGKNNASAFYFNDWELIDEDKDLKGELNFIQPLEYLGGYERRLNDHLSIGGYFKYQLKQNWNNREYNISMSYTKKVLNNIDVRLGAGATYRNHNLAVNKLTLREKALNSDYIFTTELGSLKSKTERSSVYHLGGFANHKNFFIGYTAFNVESTNISDNENITLLKHCLVGGIHSPEYKKVKASALLRYEQELFKSYSPAIRVTYNDALFAMYEYENLNSTTLTIGYQLKNKFKAQVSYNLRNLADYQKSELNLDNFVERKGYLSVGLNYMPFK